ncbi:SDR family NAD(P)-dependent oxidoreductase [Nocardia sp. BSTN01]|uniref:SDR family NAD(P)-dependent oxidoreductase n=1 Tax=Nocardia sp. BSTN01 TaxID=2783665 RepID=UPI00188E5D59|nr:SDR family NAD(P)-dependent oxidoreductase [Nocardia sp. BSTN01]
MLTAALQPISSPRRLRLGPTTTLSGKRVVVTGASSGIGRATALRLADLGAEVALVARGRDALDEVHDEIARHDGRVRVLPCDLTDRAAVQELAAELLDEWGQVDILINNAGRSIRRTVQESCKRFHDFERMMAVNYYGPVALTLELLPSMIEHGAGHIINVATWGVPAGRMPKFAAYHSSKSALTAFGHSLGAEVAEHGIHVTAVHFPLVRTPMIAPTAHYRGKPALTPAQASEWMITAIATRAHHLRPRYVPMIAAVSALSPATADSILLRIS